MRRLLESESDRGSAQEHLADLVRALAPLHPDLGEKRRVRWQVLHRNERRSHPLRPALVAIALVAVATAAGATIHHVWPQRGGAQRLAPAMHEQLRAIVVARASKPAFDGSPTPQASDNAESETPSLGDHVHDAQQDDARQAHAMPTALAPTPRNRPIHRDDPAMVGEAIRALRTDRDPARAGRVLSRYLVLYPSGVLVEDALALSIEAAVARRDPRASDYAARYLKQFPDGRFAKIARKALAPNER